jgi:hypothetical protein
LHGDGRDSSTEQMEATDAPDAVYDSHDDGPDPVQDEEGRDGMVDGEDHCRAQDARAQGPCNEVLDGVVWTGEHCVPLGSGCRCEGGDCDAVYESVEACVEARRACYDVSCEAQPVADSTCVDCDGSAFLGSFWDGRECFDLWGCECAGQGCSSASSSIEECMAVHSACDGALCHATGGQWFPASAGICSFVCGVAYVAGCGLPSDTCDCGPGRTFQPGAGCRADPACTDEDFCRATRGTWHPSSECICGFSCGQPGACGACLDSCNCGPHRNFISGRGCVPDVACGDARPEDICESTGGTWVMGTCGHYGCGFPNDLACVSPGCDCGLLSNYDEASGCVYDASCAIRLEGEKCVGQAACRPGLSCCTYWSMIDTGFCQNPCCPDYPECDESGCGPVLG